MQRRSIAAMAAVALAVSACVDRTLPLAPDHGPSSMLAMATQRSFAFLAPLGTTQPPGGTFDAGANPRVEICGYTGEFDEEIHCGRPVQQFFVDGKGPRKLGVHAGAYEADWRTKPNLDPTRSYRIRVFIGTVLLGSIDAGFDESREEAGVYYSLTRREILPIRFWISTVPRAVPSVTITAPADAAEFVEGDAITFTGAATDQDGNALSGSALVWSSSEDRQLGTGSSIEINDLTVGEHVITLTATDTHGSFAAASVTITVLPPIVQSTISAGHRHACGLTAGGAAYCWGWNTDGQLGIGSTDHPFVPTAVMMPEGVTFTSISAGYRFTVALTATGHAWAWGANYDGQLGIGNNAGARHTPVQVLMPENVTFSSISAGYRHALALTADGRAYAWGYNWRGQIGDGSTDLLRAAPVAVHMPHGVSFRSVSAGQNHSAALSTSGVAYTWGYNLYGRLGDDTQTDRHTPVPVIMPVSSFESISAGYEHTLAISTSGVAYAWGRNSSGVLGDGTNTNRLVPTAVQMPVGVHFKSIGAGEYSSHALSTTGVVYGWGNNFDGNVGDGTTPVQVIGWPPQ